MAVSIWEGKKADALISVLEDIKSRGTFSGTVKTALLNCFQNVAWINANGNSYYNALADALDSEGGDGIQFDNSFLYEASSNILPSSYGQITWGSDTGYAQNINNGILEIQISSSYTMLKLIPVPPQYAKKARIKAKFKLHSMGKHDALIFVCGDQNKKASLGVYHNKLMRYGDTDAFVPIDKTFTFDTWHILEITSADNVQKSIIDGETIYEGAVSTFGEGSSGIVFVNSGSTMGKVSFEWIDFKWSY